MAKKNPNAGKFIAKPATSYDIDLTPYLVNNTPDQTDYTTGSSNEYLDYTKSKYDPNITSKEDISVLDQIRAENQGFIPTLGNAIGRAVVNVIPTVIGNTASILDFEDYVNQDKEVGNSITRAMEEFKASVNKDYLPIYRESNESLDFGDSAWWLENGSSLAESIGAFAITGAGIGAAFGAVGRGLSTIKGLSQLGQAGKAAATILSSAGLNQAESITTAMQVYDNTLKQGGSQQDAADAAAYSININRTNILLNLTSAGAFIRSPKLTRQVREAFGQNLNQRILSEGVQEYAEESINFLAQKEGERFGETKAKGAKYNYDFNRSVDDLLSAEGIESGLLGFIGGVGQTGLTQVINKKLGRDKEENELYQSQQQSLNRINTLAQANNLKTVSSVFNSIQENTKIQNELDAAIKSNDDNKANELKYKLFGNQVFDAFANGTTEQLENTYKDIQKLSTEEASNKGLDIDPKSEFYYKAKATEALDSIKTFEDVYNDVIPKNYLNVDQVFNNLIDNKNLNKQINDTRLKLAEVQRDLLSEKLNLDITDDIDDQSSEAIQQLPSYLPYKVLKDHVDNLKTKLKSNVAEYTKLTSPETQKSVLDKEVEKEKKVADKAANGLKKEEEKQVKKSQKESVDKVKAAQVKKTESAKTDEELLAEFAPEETAIPESEETIVIDEVPLVSELEVTDPNYLANKKADIERRRQEELTIDNKLVYETGRDRSGMEFPGGWIEHQTYVNAKYDKELAELEASTITPEDKAVVNIVEHQEKVEEVKEENTDGLVRNIPEEDKLTLQKELINDTSIKRDVANTIISLNVNYVEKTKLNVLEDTIESSISDVYDNNGQLSIVDTFDTRLQDPSQFNQNTTVSISIPSFEEMESRGLQGYSREQYDQDITTVDMLPIAFVDSNNKIIGYLPTQKNVKNRVNDTNLELELEKNKQLRQFISDSRDSNIEVKITRKSSGTPMFNQPNVRKSIYDALGNGNKLSEGVNIVVIKDNKPLIGINNTFNGKLKNPDNLQNGVIYTVTPTADGTTNHILPTDVSTLGKDTAIAVVRLIQLYKANVNFPSHKSMIEERNQLAREVDLSNFTELTAALESILYINNKNDKYMLDVASNKLRLGVTQDKIFDWNDVMTDDATQEKIVDILSKRFYAVRLSDFGKRFNQFKIVDNKLDIVRHNDYFDYLNKESVITTNLHGQPIEGTDKLYFTAQSVIEISDPIIKAPLVTEEKVEEAIATKPTKPKSRLGVKLGKKKGIDIDINEDFNFISTQEFKSIEQQAEDLMKHCKG